MDQLYYYGDYVRIKKKILELREEFRVMAKNQMSNDPRD